MSQETSVWLNQNTLIGFTDKRGNAWHYRAKDQGSQSNHYAGAVPIEDVRRRLFHWKPVEGTVQSQATILSEDGVETIDIIDPTRKTIIRPDTGTILGIFKGQPGKDGGYQIHDFDEWLLTNVEMLLDDDLCIGSAGLLKGGAVAWVSIEVPENIVTPEGVVFRPHLLAGTSLDGSLSSTYARCATNVVCDNTMAAGFSEDGQEKIKVKHSRNSLGRLSEVRDALAIVHTIGDDFSRHVGELCNTTVSDGDWAKFLDEIQSLKDDKGEAKEGRSLTIAKNNRHTLDRLWTTDARVAPWKNTAWGVVQAVNTATHHELTIRNADRAERNMLRAVTGGVDKLDGETLTTLKKVLA